ncbi:MAG: hypothetical protein WD850_01995 [Candidatus Spechtbacterales bacterium]
MKDNLWPLTAIEEFTLLGKPLARMPQYPWELLAMLDEALAQLPEDQHIAESAEVAKSAILRGAVIIGENAVIKEGAIIEGPAYIGPGTVVGQHNVLRGPFVLEGDNLSGALFELKHSVVQAGTHFHSGYVGDSVIGRNCRFGVGVVVANRRIDRANVHVRVGEEKMDSGISSLGLIAGDNVRAGINVGTMPGVMLGNGAVVGPGTMVFANVPNGSTIAVRQDQQRT